MQREEDRNKEKKDIYACQALSSNWLTETQKVLPPGTTDKKELFKATAFTPAHSFFQSAKKNLVFEESCKCGD